MAIVYDGGQQAHMTSKALYAYLAELDRSNDALPMGERSEISDAAAQTIAAMWHSPESPNSTLLSTRGMVADDSAFSDFCTPREYEDASRRDKQALSYLGTYLLSKQGPSGAYRCPCCGDDHVGWRGRCDECKEASCEMTKDASGEWGHWECQRETSCPF